MFIIFAFKKKLKMKALTSLKTASKLTIVFIIFIVSIYASNAQVTFVPVNYSGGTSYQISIPTPGETATFDISYNGSLLILATNNFGQIGEDGTAFISSHTVNTPVNASTGSYSSTGAGGLGVEDNFADGNTVNGINYFAFKILDILNNEYYGYITMNINAPGGGSPVTWTVESYAYQSTIDATILTGEGDPALSVTNEFITNVKVFNSDKELSIANLPEIADYKIYTITGQIIKEGTAQKNNATINTSKLTTGVYVLKVIGNDSGKILTMKIIL